ncbi:hypothetical protein EVAR_51684_1 [Eumeta japonica]|uniref:Uncharacterized protein n=1 Tax=Eumeta variegata TaxID=151549 RepID=A0A4C1Y2C0_EUMVA|nr:hypothetical protein EVAR_51684_1 [Eumeta japonica]
MLVEDQAGTLERKDYVHVANVYMEAAWTGIYIWMILGNKGERTPAVSNAAPQVSECVRAAGARGSPPTNHAMFFYACKRNLDVLCIKETLSVRFVKSRPILFTLFSVVCRDDDGRGRGDFLKLVASALRYE